ncbi:MAG: caspase family protein, partial [Nitrospirae bacterium]|nr:caspase family protein [Nitrospirota bacterium]
HGDKERGKYYYMSVDTNVDKLEETAVPSDNITNTVKDLAGKTIFFLDTCHSGGIYGSKGARNDPARFVNELASAESGAIVFAASMGGQVSWESTTWGNGAFTKAVVEGIEGKADIETSSRVTVILLEYYLSKRVPALAKEINREQTPASAKPYAVADFPISIPIVIN